MLKFNHCHTFIAIYFHAAPFSFPTILGLYLFGVSLMGSPDSFFLSTASWNSCSTHMSTIYEVQTLCTMHQNIVVYRESTPNAHY